jgi:hypothetical protein
LGNISEFEVSLDHIQCDALSKNKPKVGERSKRLVKEGIQMTIKHVKRYSISLIIRKYKSKPKKYHLKP